MLLQWYVLSRVGRWSKQLYTVKISTITVSTPRPEQRLQETREVAGIAVRKMCIFVSRVQYQSSRQKTGRYKSRLE